MEGLCLNCLKKLHGRQKSFCSDACRVKWWSDARKAGAGKRSNSKPHCGHPARSKRLARTLDVLIEARGYHVTTLNIQKRTGSMKPSTDIDDLRRAGYPVSMAKHEVTTDEGRRIYSYRWEGK